MWIQEEIRVYVFSDLGLLRGGNYVVCKLVPPNTLGQCQVTEWRTNGGFIWVFVWVRTILTTRYTSKDQSRSPKKEKKVITCIYASTCLELLSIMWILISAILSSMIRMLILIIFLIWHVFKRGPISS